MLEGQANWVIGRRILGGASLALAAALALAGCATEAGPTPPPALPECSAPVTVTVAFTDTIPVFSWGPECLLGRLVVEQGLDEYWGTETPGPSTYAPPIVYGINPPNSAAEEPALPLERGLTYTVSVWRFVSVLPESLQLLGSTDFTY